MPIAEEIKGLIVQSAHANRSPLQQQMELIDHDTEIVPGIQIMPAPGHTPGHMALVVSSGDEQHLHLADTVVHPILMEQADWYPAFDLLPEPALTTKRQLLGLAASDRALVLAFHFRSPAWDTSVKRERAGNGNLLRPRGRRASRMLPRAL